MAPPKTLNKPNVITRTPSTGQYDPFNPGGSTFQTQTLPTYTPATRADSTRTPTQAENNAAINVNPESIPGIPQSFVDDFSTVLTARGHDPSGNGQMVATGNWKGQSWTVPLNPDGSLNQDAFAQEVTRAWNSEPTDAQQKARERDRAAIDSKNTSQIAGIQTQAALGGPAQDKAVANKLWGNLVDPAVAGANKTRADQITTDRQVENDLTGATNTFTNTINNNQASRMADIQGTNDRDTGYAQDFMTETLAANKRNVGFADQYSAAAAGANAEQTGAFNTLRDQNNANNALQTGQYNTFAGQMSGINANQTGLYNNFMGDISSANNRQNQNLSQFGGAVSSANSQQNQIVAQYSQELAQMNEQDKAAYLQYINETNPLMAQMIAQASNPEYVANQENAVQQFKNNYNPEVTGQERFLAEQARRKFESDDKSSRDAVMQQLAGRGLRSGGLTIANQQATQQQLAQDRQMNELGLSASAVGRAERNRVDYSNASDALRNADDSMRHFQDAYAQQDAMRRGNLALDRNQQNLATTRQVSDRDSANYQARTQSNSLNYERNRDYYDAGTQTVNNNFARTQAGYDAGTQTNQDNAGRDRDTFDAGRATNLDNDQRNQSTFNGSTLTTDNNFTRTGGAIGVQMGVNQTNLGNFGGAISGPNGVMTVNDRNSDRYQGGLTLGDLGAGSVLGAQQTLGGTKTTNRASESQAANNWVPVATGTAEAGSRIQQGLTREQQDALNQLYAKDYEQRGAAALGLG